MSDFTPTTDMILCTYIVDVTEKNDGVMVGDASYEFDRWLAARRSADVRHHEASWSHAYRRRSAQTSRSRSASSCSQRCNHCEGRHIWCPLLHDDEVGGVTERHVEIV